MSNLKSAGGIGRVKPMVGRLADILAAYIELIKPRIQSLLIYTAITGTVLASGFELQVNAFIATLVGGLLTSGGASALNIALETDIDGAMRRTAKRPVTANRISNWHAAIFGLVLNFAGFAVLYLMTNWLAATIAIIGSVLYVGLYTLILKRSTVQNIVVGGAAGAVPALVGYASVTGDLSLGAWYLFAIIFFWTPPHFWALALLIKDDYKKAGIPMLPVVKGTRLTTLLILAYTVLLPCVCLLFYLEERLLLGWVYIGVAGALSAIFIALAARLHLSATRKNAITLYLFSLLYVFILFGAVMLDVRLSYIVGTGG